MRDINMKTSDSAYYNVDSDFYNCNHINYNNFDNNKASAGNETNCNGY